MTFNADVPRTPRSVAATVAAIHAIEGGGFGVFRPFPTQDLEMLDPFLLLDEMEPTEHEPGSFKGAPDHPHRGFETVTYLLEGEVEHRDSNGGHGIIGAGGVQWMTAGDGIVHSEMASRRLQTEGGRVHGFQLWVNLPKEKKRTSPRYQSLESGDLGFKETSGWTIRVIAGEFGGDAAGVTGPTTTHTPVNYAHLTVRPGANVALEVSEDQNIGVFAFVGSGHVNETELSMRSLAVLPAQAGATKLTIAAASGPDVEPLQVLVMAGRPLNEPVARYGPFVMNTQEEIVEAVEDFQQGRLGSIPAAL